MSSYVLGVDPGQSGAFVLLDSQARIISKHVFTTNDQGIDFKAYIASLRALPKKPTKICLEEIHALYGSSAKATFSFGRSYQVAMDGVSLLDCDITLVRPKDWQKVVYENKRRSNESAKETSRRLVRDIFPDEDFLKSKRSRVPHDGLIDAALIAYYGLVTNK